MFFFFHEGPGSALGHANVCLLSKGKEGMESLLASSDDHLLPLASYKMGPTASYVESRQEATFFSSVSGASPEGVRVLTFNVNSDAFIDANSLFFHF